jgi:uncharacterized membrane protein
MNTTVTTQVTTDNSEKLKNLTVIVYICQILTFALAGLPLLVGVAINFYNRNDVQGTWLESHFDWQIKTVWVTLAGFAISGLIFTLSLEIGLFILLPTLILLIYRIVIGWTALAANQPIKNTD